MTPWKFFLAVKLFIKIRLTLNDKFYDDYQNHANSRKWNPQCHWHGSHCISFSGLSPTGQLEVRFVQYLRCDVPATSTNEYLRCPWNPFYLFFAYMQMKSIMEPPCPYVRLSESTKFLQNYVCDKVSIQSGIRKLIKNPVHCSKIKLTDGKMKFIIRSGHAH